METKINTQSEAHAGMPGGVLHLAAAENGRSSVGKRRQRRPGDKERMLLADAVFAAAPATNL